MLYTDEHAAYRGLPNHVAVKHGVGEYVDGLAHTNGIESFWALLKRGYHGTYHQMSPKHLDRYVGEFSGRHNQREQDTLDQDVRDGPRGRREAAQISGPDTVFINPGIEIEKVESVSVNSEWFENL